MKINDLNIQRFKTYLKDAEKAEATQRRYLRDLRDLQSWLINREADKETMLEYKSFLMKNYALTSVNSKLSSINRFWDFIGIEELKVRMVKVQRRIFADTDRVLDARDYRRLLGAARKAQDKRLYLILLTLGSTGIRISELKYVTVQSLETQTVHIDCKGKCRVVFLPDGLCTELRRYAAEMNIRCGSVFVTIYGNPIDRSNLSKQMKRLAAKANVSENKVFPHNMRHLFARTYYGEYKDIVRLADILGHSSVNTTRIYTMDSGDVHKKQLDKMYNMLN